MVQILRRSWAEIDLDSLEHNYAELRKRLSGDCRFLAIVKADAYGHGAVPVARRLCELGAEQIAVSNIEEAVQLRRGGLKNPILALGYTPPELAAELCDFGISQEINDLDYAKSLSRELSGLKKRLKVHLKLDSGMSRLGFTCYEEERIDEIEEAGSLAGLEPVGAFTHFASADIKDDSFTLLQFERFMAALTELKARGLDFELRHCANSAAIINYPQTHLDMVRPGIAVYGQYPSGDMKSELELRPVMSLKSSIVQLKKLKAGASVSYGRKMCLERDSEVAVIPIGYADGLPRSFSNDLEVLVRGQRARLIGTVCMDMCMLDITELEGVGVGDTVTLFGSEGGETVTMEQWADKAKTITYEIACGISKRVPRIYMRGGRAVDSLRYIV